MENSTEAITLNRVREALAQAVATQGKDFIYNPGGLGQCFYRPFPTMVADDPRRLTGCLVGVALDILGVDYDHDDAQPVNEMIDSEDLGDRFTSSAVAYLCTVQVSQDNGASWGQAYAGADRALRNQ